MSDDPSSADGTKALTFTEVLDALGQREGDEVELEVGHNMGSGTSPIVHALGRLSPVSMEEEIRLHRPGEWRGVARYAIGGDAHLLCGCGL